MTKENIEKLAEMGEIYLRSRVDRAIGKVFDCVNFLGGEDLDFSSIDKPDRTDKIDLNKIVTEYLMVRSELIDCGLNPTSYDNRVQNAVHGIDYLKQKLKIIMEERKEQQII